MVKDVDNLINELCTNFNPKQYKVIAGRFGLKTGKRATLQEIGDDLGITRERVRQIEEQVLKKITARIGELANDFLELSNKYLASVGGVRRDDHFINDIKYLL